MKINRKSKGVWLITTILMIILLAIMANRAYYTFYYTAQAENHGHNNPATEKITKYSTGSYKVKPGYYDVGPATSKTVVNDVVLLPGQSFHGLYVDQGHDQTLNIKGNHEIRVAPAKFSKLKFVEGKATIKNTYFSVLGGSELAVGKYKCTLKTANQKDSLLILELYRSGFFNKMHGGGSRNLSNGKSLTLNVRNKGYVLFEYFGKGVKDFTVTLTRK